MKKGNILLVTQKVEVANVLEAYLTLEGYQIQMAPKEGAALDAIQFDIILVDSHFDMQVYDSILFRCLHGLSEGEKPALLYLKQEPEFLADPLSSFERKNSLRLGEILYQMEYVLLHRLLKSLSFSVSRADTKRYVMWSMSALPIIDFLAECASFNKSISVFLSSSSSLANVWFAEGRMVDVMVDELRGVEALSRLALWKEAKLMIRTLYRPPFDFIKKPWMVLLEEAYHKLLS
ncbi:response regulator transcription factor [Pajaroellobacter abortibovis]|uniref:Uncharacterized protein n=1 Tax=Pajaroellobacter abortibovis TaxID=1882918 RepID=A0A1L6MXM6_9BACT|nr:response regulator transcription factor [Pajaroellobacter abortibovis]APS00226.1 hypothetical protein BCY86_05675 [Pajaroellobacter abortibovis]